MEPAETFAPRPGVQARTVAGGAVLVDMNSGEIFELNAVGAEAWAILSAGATARDICRELRGRYPVAPSTLDRDVTALLQSLVSSGLIERKP